jgi:putative membrane protein
MIILSFFVIGCTRANNNNSEAIAALREELANHQIIAQGGIVEIRERMFATQVNEIYLNSADYLGRNIRLEGIFRIIQHNDETFFYVLRYAPDGCCGGRGFVGFEVRMAAGYSRQFPADNSWVEATGILREFSAGSGRFLYLELFSLNVLTRRGAEFVIR